MVSRRSRPRAVIRQRQLHGTPALGRLKAHRLPGGENLDDGITPLYQRLEFLSPLPNDHCRRQVGFVSTQTDGTVVDLGCGWGSMLLRLLRASAKNRGIGSDRDRGILATPVLAIRRCRESRRSRQCRVSVWAVITR